MIILAIGILDTLTPDDSCVVESSQDVKEAVTRFIEELHGPTAFVPAVGRIVIEGLVEPALIREHVEEHVGQVHLWEQIIEVVSERICLEGVGVLVEFLYVVFSKA